MNQETQNKQREIIQKQAEQLSLIHKHLLLTWATGTGKGRALMRCIDASVSPKKWLVVVPEILQIDNFKRDLEKHGFDHLLRNKIHDIICYASLDKYEKSRYNLALNEVHKLSDSRWESALTIDFDQVISDSATVPESIKIRLMTLCTYHEYNITLNEAIETGLLPAPKIHLIAVELDKVHKNYEIKRKVGKLTKIFKTTQLGYNTLLEKDIEFWEEQSVEKGYPQWIRNRINQIAITRKKFLSECKTEKAKELLQTLENTRYICFTGSTNQADILGKDHAVHSKKSAKHNKEIVKKFDDFEINSIFANKMMREGMNLEGIEAGIIIQLDSGVDSGLSFLQMTGRSMRSLIPNMYILYAKGTQDEKYLKRALTNIDKKYIVKR